MAGDGSSGVVVGADSGSPPLKKRRSSIDECPGECQKRGTATPHLLVWALEALPTLMLPPAVLDVPGGMETGESAEAQRDSGSDAGPRAQLRPTPGERREL